MSRRDRVAEILQVKGRGQNRAGIVSYTLFALGKEWQKLSGDPNSKPDFYVIRAVTILEVFTRNRLMRLEDHDSRFAQRAATLLKDHRIDFDLLQSIQGRAITLGDIVGHSVQVNTFGQIIDHFKTLLDLPLPDLLAKAVDRWRTEIKKLPPEPIIPDYNTMAGHLTRLFEVRHILCHELPTKPVYAESEVAQFIQHAAAFADALEAVLDFEMYGLTPLTQTDMNINAAEKLRAKEAEMATLVESISSEISLVDGELDALKDSQEKWFAHRNAYCDFATLLSQGGTIRPLLWGIEAQEMTESRIAQLMSWKDARLSL